MRSRYFWTAFLVWAAGFTCEGLWLDDMADCQLSTWTQWSETYSYGLQYRERKVLRYATAGGKPCSGELVEIKDDQTSGSSSSTPLPIPVTAKLMVDHFLRPHKKTSKRGLDPGSMTRDLMLIIDGSGSITQQEFQASLMELITLLHVMCPDNDPFNINYNRAALIEFSNSAREVFDFDDYQTSNQLFAALRRLPFIGKDTCTGSAFNKAAGMFTLVKGSRNDPNVKREVLILTDGKSNCGPNAVQAAKGLQQVADVYALVIGSPASKDQREIESYVSQPVSSHLFATPNFQDLTLLVTEVLHQIQTHPNVSCMSFNP